MSRRKKAVLLCIVVLVAIGGLMFWKFFSERTVMVADEMTDMGRLPPQSGIGDPGEGGGAVPPTGYELPGMPEGHTLTEEQMAQKRAMAERGALEAFQAMRPGEDYVDGEFIYLADSRAEANLIAAAYDGEVVNFADGFAVARLKDGSPFTLADLLAAAADTGNNMPPVELNHILKAF